MKTRPLIPAIISGKCPRCRQGKMFKKPVYQITSFTEMHDRCPHCNLLFEVEPSFFYGSMYVGYGISIATIIAGVVGINLFVDNPPLWLYITVTVSSIILMIPINFRYGRIIYLYIFGLVKYDKNL
ncbi:MAG: DUF983 domain-containing protein [Bacteroidetes bacterium]|nr:MAG: DUF983 domain-containing protein [Bacteroidota bacterium]